MGVGRACRDRARLPASGPGFHVQCKRLQTHRIWLEWARLVTSGPGLLAYLVKPGPVGTYRRRPGRACFGTGPGLLGPGQACHWTGAGAGRAWREWARVGAGGVAEVVRPKGNVLNFLLRIRTSFFERLKTSLGLPPAPSDAVFLGGR